MTVAARAELLRCLGILVLPRRTAAAGEPRPEMLSVPQAAAATDAGEGPAAVATSVSTGGAAPEPRALVGMPAVAGGMGGTAGTGLEAPGMSHRPEQSERLPVGVGPPPPVRTAPAAAAALPAAGEGAAVNPATASAPGAAAWLLDDSVEERVRALERQRSTVAVCTGCRLAQMRTQAVFGEGDPAAALMVIGEAPGNQEDLQGEPFLRDAGRLLDALLRALGLSRSEVFLTTLVKCRPPGGRPAHAEELEACRGHLQRQLALVRPRVVLALGSVVAEALLGAASGATTLRGRVHDQDGMQVIVTYELERLLQRPALKAEAWRDLRQVWACLVRSRGYTRPR